MLPVEPKGQGPIARSASARRPGVDTARTSFASSAVSARQTWGTFQSMRAPTVVGQSTLAVRRPASAAASQSVRRAEVLGVPVPAVAIRAQGVEGPIGQDAVARGGDSRDQGGVARIGHGGKDPRDARGRSSFAQEAAQLGDAQAVAVGLAHVVGPQAVDRHHEKGAAGEALGGLGNGRDRHESTAQEASQAQEAARGAASSFEGKVGARLDRPSPTR